MARLDPQIRSDAIGLLWFKARQAFELFGTDASEDNRSTLNDLVRCLSIMLDKPTKDIAARLRDVQ